MSSAMSLGLFVWTLDSVFTVVVFGGIILLVVGGVVVFTIQDWLEKIRSRRKK